MHVRAKDLPHHNRRRRAWLNYPRIFEILNGVNYNGWVSIVYEGQDAEAEETAVPKAVNYLRQFAPGA